MIWKDPINYAKKDDKVTTVLFFGYNFDPSDGSKKRYGVEIRDNSGKKIWTAWDNLTITSPYVAQVDISAGSGISFKPGEARLVLLYDGAVLATCLVTWSERPPKPVPLPTIVAVKATLYTATHKEAAGQVEMTFYHNNRKLADSLHRREMRIFNLKREYEGHIGSYEVWEKNHTATFTPPKGLAFNPEYRQGEEFRIDFALGAVPGERNIHWRGNITFFVTLNDGHTIEVGKSGGFWFRNNVVEEPPQEKGNRSLTRRFPLPPLPPK
jgi:hypothetical protein